MCAHSKLRDAGEQQLVALADRRERVRLGGAPLAINHTRAAILLFRVCRQCAGDTPLTYTHILCVYKIRKVRKDTFGKVLRDCRAFA